MSSEKTTMSDPVQPVVLPRVQVTNPFCGLIYMQVCAVDDATDEEILEACNRENLCGTTNGWAGVIRDGSDELAGDKAAPVKCEEHEGRTHFLVYC